MVCAFRRITLHQGRILQCCYSALFVLLFSIVASAQTQDTALFQRLDTISNTLNDLESKVRSTLMFGGSSPVAFSGEARLRMQFHNFSEYPDYIKRDRSYLATNWDGNESFIRLGMVVRAGRNAVLWSKIGFQNTLPGKRYLVQNTSEWTPEQFPHDKSGIPAIIHEDMMAGIAIRTVDASFWLKMGNVNWLQASPLTYWKSQARCFAWDYLPFEVEQPIARYYEYNIAVGEKSGRAAWNKKPLNGINLESINLPWNLYANVAYGTYERYDNFEREFVDFSNDLGYAGAPDASKGLGIGDSYRHLLMGRIARSKVFGDVTMGVNVLRYFYDIEIANNKLFQGVFAIKPNKKSFIKEPFVASLDLNGVIDQQLSIQADVGVSFIDTTWITHDTTPSSPPCTLAYSRSSIIPAAYALITSTHLVPLKAEVAIVGKGYYSPLSFIASNDAFYPFGANLVGSGKFLSRGEGSPYVQNMAGLRLTATPKLPGYGHLKISAGNHFQVSPSRDLIYFPYRLNGQDFSSVFHSSYNRWGNDLLDHSIVWADPGNPVTPYAKRLGDESFRTNAYNSPYGPDAGGLRSDYLSMFEGFVAYESQAQADSNLYDTTTIFTRSKFVPEHRKWTQNFEIDGSYDIGGLIGYKRDLLLGGYAAVNAISTTPNFLKDAVLWSFYGRFEPSIALDSKFYIIGLAGYEVWRSDNAYTTDSTPVASGNQGHAIKTPIDFRDVAFGVGFDWDMLARVGLHVRAKWMRHEDVNKPVNNWSMPLASVEIKMWF